MDILDVTESALSQDENLLELPSCIESLASSACQLRQLALNIEQYYIKALITYGYTVDRSHDIQNGHPTPTKQRPVQKPDLERLLQDDTCLRSLDSLQRFLPFLHKLASFVEQCFITIEVTLRRSTYYLSRAADRTVKTDNMTDDDEFLLPPETKLHPVFLAIMDLIYALISLDKAAREHTDIAEGLGLFSSVCKSALDSKTPLNGQLESYSLPREKLITLLEFISTIQLTLCNEKKTIFQQCIEHLQHLNMTLSVGGMNKGYKNLCEHLEGYIAFYGENLIDQSSQQHGLGNGPALANTGSQTRTNQLMAMFLINCNVISTLYMTSSSRKILGLWCLFLLYGCLFKRTHKRLNRLMFQILVKHRTNNMVHLIGSDSNVALDSFLTENCPGSLLDTKILKRLASQCEFLLKTDLEQDLDQQTMKIKTWLAMFEKTMLSGDDKSRDERSNSRLIAQGCQLAEELNHLMRSVFAIHKLDGQQLSSNNLVASLRMVSLLKAVEASLVHYNGQVETSTIRAEQLVRTRWRKLMTATRKRIVAMHYSERKLDTNSILTISSLASEIQYLSSDQGRMILSLCVPMMVSSLTPAELAELNSLMSLIPTDITRTFTLDTNCGYLFWNKPRFNLYYNHASERDLQIVDEINHFHLAVDDMTNLFLTMHSNVLEDLNLSWLMPFNEEFLRSLEADLVEQFESEYLSRVCQEFEVDLRIQVHRNLQVDGHDPFKRHLYNFKHLLAQSRSRGVFRIMNRQVSLRHCLEEHLTRSCYNMTTIEPHDWFTYDQMINLARHKYGLQFVNMQLPAQTIEHGVDLLDITRNLALFVSRYNYDLINQLFIEKCTNRLSTSSSNSIISGTSMLSGLTQSCTNQMLNVVQIRHISRSIQTHGFGVLNSSVNCTYQVMKRLINLFSKQLADDRLRAILTKEHQQLTMAQTKRPTLTFDKANRMAKRFRLNALSVGDAPNQRPLKVDLDSLRQSITQLGNLLGFIRMLKSGALQCASRSVDYLPDLDDLSLLRLERFVKSEFQGYASESLAKAAHNFDQCLADFDRNFSPKTNYFNIIISLFSKTLSDKAGPSANNKPKAEHSGEDTPASEARAADCSSTKDASASADNQLDRRNHLRLFYLVVPALSINYIDYVINCKERITLRSSAARSGGLISDDGFSMGVAFLLTVLDQSQEFAKVEWFEQVRMKLDEDTREVGARIGDPNYEEILRQTSSMTFRRLNRLRQEYDGLDYTLNSALLFFRSSSLATPSEAGE